MKFADLRLLRSCAGLMLALFSFAASAGPVNINTADAGTLSRELKGIGEAKAAAIVDYRQKHGAFRSVDELTLVKGVGQKLIEQNRADLRIDKSAASAPASKPIQLPAAAVAKPAAARKK